MASPNAPVDELEQRAERERERVSRDMARLRQDMRREMDVRGRVEDGIHQKPGTFYGGAAGAALFVGYIFARILKA
ncbi:MAG: hypothetical protein ACLGPM_09280 [Acidobacteriota bacterium]